MHRRNKIGGLLDRRFGENDPSMTPEEKAAERFVRENERRNKKGSMFDLEDDDAEGVQLTHMGRSLDLEEGNVADDFDEEGLDLSGSEDHATSDEDGPHRKRRRLSDPNEAEGLDGEEVEDEPERKKSKNEVMKEVIAKSKMHKYERQQAKEDDEELRAQLDKGLSDIYQLLGGRQSKAPPPPPAPNETPLPQMNADRLALLEGKDRKTADKEYDERLRQMAFDKRSAPTDRTKTEEQKAAEEAERLRKLEEQRQRRMRGEEESDEEEEGSKDVLPENDALEDDAGVFGFEAPTNGVSSKQDFGVEDEDNFIIDEDLVASGTESDLSMSEQEDDSSDQSVDEEDDAEFLGGLLSAEDAKNPAFSTGTSSSRTLAGDTRQSGVAYTYPCPQTHEEFLGITAEVPTEEVPLVVQRIRALYHPRLKEGYKAKLEVFAGILVDHISYMANHAVHPSLSVVETLIRHVHSLAKAFPEHIGKTFRKHLEDLHHQRPLQPTAGDLMLLTAIGAIFPTSDHFHQVVTPAILSIARYLGQSVPESLSDLATGAYLSSLSLQYQVISKRYIPELANYTCSALISLAPSKPSSKIGHWPEHQLSDALRYRGSEGAKARNLHFWDVVSDDTSEPFKLALLSTFASLLDSMADLWATTTAFTEILTPAKEVLSFLSIPPNKKLLPKPTHHHLQKTLSTLSSLLHTSKHTRRPLLLHNHRPLAIKTSLPRFEETFNPDKHYDPDRDRAEIGKLKAEHKRERKGALRELRKDANFIARESLREKKERDQAYEKKYKRLVAEIQGEEGREAKNYEREKKMRKGRR